MKRLLTSLEWIGIVLLWFWPLTLRALGCALFIYLVYLIVQLWPGANW